MNRKDLINHVSDELEISKVKAKDQVSFVLLALKSAVTSCDKVSLKSFGSFSVKEIGSKSLKHIITKQPFTTKPSKYIKFKPSGGLKSYVNEDVSS